MIIRFQVAIAIGCVGLSACGDNLVSSDPVPEPITLAFTDISDQSPALLDGAFRGNPGWDTSDKYSPGVSLADLDGDGHLDLVQPRNDARSAEHSTARLYRGIGDGSFVDATPEGWDIRRRAPTAISFDFDADGDLDVFLGVDGAPSVLYRNDGNMTFVDVSAEAGFDALTDRVFVAAAGDVDNDGDLDLYTGAWNASAEDHGPGTALNRVFLNDGTGVFLSSLAKRSATDVRRWRRQWSTSIATAISTFTLAMTSSMIVSTATMAMGRSPTSLHRSEPTRALRARWA